MRPGQDSDPELGGGSEKGGKGARQPSVTSDVIEGLRSVRISAAAGPAGPDPRANLPTALVSHPKCFGHVTKNQECVQRLDVLVGNDGVFTLSVFDPLLRINNPEPARIGDLIRVHDWRYREQSN